MYTTMKVPSIAINYADGIIESIGMGGELYKRETPLKAENAKMREQGARLFDKVLELFDENDKLRKLVADMWDGMCGYAHECRDCEHYKLHEGQRFAGECRYHIRMRELGIEVDG